MREANEKAAAMEAASQKFTKRDPEELAERFQEASEKVAAMETARRREPPGRSLPRSCRR